MPSHFLRRDLYTEGLRFHFFESRHTPPRFFLDSKHSALLGVFYSLSRESIRLVSVQGRTFDSFLIHVARTIAGRNAKKARAFNDISIFFDCVQGRKGLATLLFHVALPVRRFHSILWCISTAHFTSLQTFEKLITRPSLCRVHYFSSWLAQESMQVDCWLLRCLKHVRVYVSFTMSRWMCLRHLRDTSFPRWEFAKGSREWMRSTREVGARKLGVFY